MAAPSQRPESKSNRPRRLPSAAGSGSRVGEAIEYAKQSRGDCTNLVTFVALQETGMLDAYMEKNRPSGSVPPSHICKPVIATRADGKLSSQNNN